jgi:ribosome-associated protein
MPTPEIRQQVAVALEAVHAKKAEDVTLLQLPRESSTFTDYFLICSGGNPRQVQAIADEVDERLSKGMRVEPHNREGYEVAEWILLDYVDFVVHIFNAQRRAYYDLERLWKSANRLTAEDLLKPETPQAAAPRRQAKQPAAKKKAPAVKAAAKQSARRTAKKKTSAVKSAKRSTASASARKPPAKRTGAKKRTR